MNKNKTKKEIWKPIKGYEGCYEVSSKGRVKSFKYNKPRILKLNKDTGGYLRCSLCLNGRVKVPLVHRLVIVSFVGEINNNMTVNHIDENKKNNNLSNLEIVSQRENTRKFFSKRNKSNLSGIRWLSKSKQWRTSVFIGGIQYHIINSQSIEACKGAYIEANKLLDCDPITIKKEILKIRQKFAPNRKTSKYKYVIWHIATQKWSVQIRRKNKQAYIACLPDEKEAALVAKELMQPKYRNDKLFNEKVKKIRNNIRKGSNQYGKINSTE